jgi:hypothetical protein
VGISGHAGSAGAELERTTARTPRWGARPLMGRALSFAAACSIWGTTGRSLVGSPRRPRTVVGRTARPDRTCSRPAPSAGPVVGRASGCRTVQTGRCAGDIVEPAGSGVGPTEAGHAPGTFSAGLGRLGSASRRTGFAAYCGALLGRAGPGRLGCAEDRGARSSRGAVVVSTRRVSACRAFGRAGRRSSAMERASSNSIVVSAGRGSCRTWR